MVTSASANGSPRDSSCAGVSAGAGEFAGGGAGGGMSAGAREGANVVDSKGTGAAVAGFSSAFCHLETEMPRFLLHGLL